MIIKTLKPIRDKDAYSKHLAQLLSYDLFQMIFKPLIDLLSIDKKENAKASPLIQAFADRRIYFDDGYVFGKFSAAISKALGDLGGKYNKTRRAFKISLTQFPPDIRSAIARGSTVEQDALSAVQKKVKDLATSNIVIPGVNEITGNVLDDLHEQFKKVTPADLEIPIEMNDVQREKLRLDYNENIDLNIKNLSQESIERLRLRVEVEVGQGTRAEKLKDILYSEYGVMDNRAKFIARQETGLFVSKFRQTRYEDAGLNQYEWSTSGDERVRESHKELNGRVFSWDNPPIVDKATGRKANPGEDFGCRCVALPVIKVAGVNVLNSKWNSTKIQVDLKPAEYFELVKEGFGYPTIQHLFATLLEDKVKSIKEAMADGIDLPNPVLEYKWTGKRILFWQDGRHRMKAALDDGIESVRVDVIVPEDEVEEAFRIMPSWFISKLNLLEVS